MKRVRGAAAVLAALAIFTLSIILYRQMNRIPDVFKRGEIHIEFNCTVPAGNEEALALLRDYFSMRCGSFAHAAHIKDDADSSDDGLTLSETVRSNEKNRIKKLRKLQKAWHCRFSEASADVRIEGWKQEDGSIVCLLYEFQWFQNWYSGYTTPETADLSGYGVRHALRLQPTDSGIELITDDYDEGRPTFAASKERLLNADYLKYAGTSSMKQSDSEISFWDKIFKKPSVLPINSAEFLSSYHPGNAVAYADTWAAAYNTGQYPDLASLGGDCCNFTSQCLYAGGMPLTVDWTHNGRDVGSPAWISCSRLYALLTGQTNKAAVGRGIAVIRMADAAGRTVRLGGKRCSASTVFYKGSPIFYCWSGEYLKTGWWNHVALCVGTMGDGTPAVSCHTADKYHVKWNYGGSVCDYGVVQLTST